MGDPYEGYGPYASQYSAYNPYAYGFSQPYAAYDPYAAYAGDPYAGYSLYTTADANPYADPGQSQEAFRQVVVQEHNRVRAAVGVPPLRWSHILESAAQEYAYELAQRGGGLHHSHPSQRAGQGENLWKISIPFDPVAAAEESIRAFEAEQHWYRPGTPISPKGLQAIGHYTQMVWWSTEAVGAAMAVGPRGTYVVYRYGPPGNVVGQVPF